MNLLIDVGNTRLKYAFVRSNGELRVGFLSEKLPVELRAEYERHGPVDVFLSGSGEITNELREQLRPFSGYWLEAGPGIRYPVEIEYGTPETLGTDRLAACIGARELFPGKDLLVIDSGTAITFNILSAAGVFKGGNISPGLLLRFRALHDYTERLPLVEPEPDWGEYGGDTQEAIRNGVMNGILFETERYIEEFRHNHPAGGVVLTGGNSSYWEGKLPAFVCFRKELVFIGLNAILEFCKKCNRI